jgi:hypothetical protein
VVGVLSHHPATRSGCGDHALQGPRPLGEVHQERSLVHQVEGALLQRVGEDVVAPDLELAVAVIVDETEVQVGCQDAAAGADSLGQPPRHAPGPAANLQAAPARADAPVAEVAGRGAVERFLQGTQPGMLPVPGLIEDVAGHSDALFIGGSGGRPGAMIAPIVVSSVVRWEG